MKKEKVSQCYVERTCEVCSASFFDKRSNIKRGWGRFCKRLCRDISQKISPVDQLLSRVDRSGGPESCWLWQGAPGSTGYGKFSGSYTSPARASWEIEHSRSIPKGLVIRHLCPGRPNRLCCNPSHLDIGTKADNNADSVAIRGHAFGERSGTAKLNELQVIEIRRRREKGESGRVLSVEFNVSTSLIYAIGTRASWKHVP